MRDIRWFMVAAVTLQALGLVTLGYALAAVTSSDQQFGLYAVAGVLQLAALVSVLMAQLDEE